MGKKISYLLVLLAVVIGGLQSSAAKADGGTELIYFHCAKNNFLKVRGMILYDIVPELNKQTISLDNLRPGQEMQECQLSPSDKVVVKIGIDPNSPKNDGAIITLNGKYVGQLDFDEPDSDYTYIFTRAKDGSILIDHTEPADKAQKEKP